jgi:hypothetical protein
MMKEKRARETKTTENVSFFIFNLARHRMKACGRCSVQRTLYTISFGPRLDGLGYFP